LTEVFSIGAGLISLGFPVRGFYVKAALLVGFLCALGGLLVFEGALLTFGFCDLAEAVHARGVALLGSTGTRA
jgi:hypothetical protein